MPSERGVDLLPDPRAGRVNGRAGSGDSDAGGNVPVPLRVTKKRRSTQPRAGGDVSASDVSVGSADLAPGMTSTLRGKDGPAAPGPAYANLSYEADTPQDPRKERPSGSEAGRRRRRQKAAEADPIRDPVMRNIAAQQQQLRVHIKAQPGTAVHITPSATPPTRPGDYQPPAYHAVQPPSGRAPHGARPFSSGGESETEI